MTRMKLKCGKAGWVWCASSPDLNDAEHHVAAVKDRSKIDSSFTRTRSRSKSSRRPGERPEGAAPHAEADEARGGAEGRVPDAGADARGLSEGVCVCVLCGLMECVPVCGVCSLVSTDDLLLICLHYVYCVC